MAEDAGARTFGGSHAEIGKTIRLIIASPVHLVRDGLAATLRDRAEAIVVDVTDLSPRGIAKIADAQPDVVLVDLYVIFKVNGSPRHKDRDLGIHVMDTPWLIGEHGTSVSRAMLIVRAELLRLCTGRRPSVQGS